eukprot:m.129539 g.129539  ORF g.129539 m.129539 type:complete len:280 (-) comp16408_c1_seq2:383-1222(-)
MGREIQVEQRSEEWMRIRQSVILTASNFADALGRGIGSAWDFYRHNFGSSTGVGPRSPTRKRQDETNALQQHGIDWEPIIGEAYEMLSGNRLVPSGVFIPDESDPLHGLVAASPDGKVVRDGQVVGLVEFKAPVFSIYSDEGSKRFCGVPPKYICQMQGQMMVSGVHTWCDFLALCVRTRSLVLCRVYYSAQYASSMRANLFKLATCIRKSIVPNYLQHDPPDLNEHTVVVEPRLRVSSDGTLFKGDCGIWLTWSMLVGSPLPPSEEEGANDASCNTQH